MAPSIKLLYVSELNQMYLILGPEMSIVFYYMCYYVHADKCTDMNCKPFFAIKFLMLFYLFEKLTILFCYIVVVFWFEFVYVKIFF